MVNQLCHNHVLETKTNPEPPLFPTECKYHFCHRLYYHTFGVYFWTLLCAHNLLIYSDVIKLLLLWLTIFNIWYLSSQCFRLYSPIRATLLQKGQGDCESNQHCAKCWYVHWFKNIFISLWYQVLPSKHMICIFICFFCIQCSFQSASNTHVLGYTCYLFNFFFKNVCLCMYFILWKADQWRERTKKSMRERGDW